MKMYEAQYIHITLGTIRHEMECCLLPFEAVIWMTSGAFLWYLRLLKETQMLAGGMNTLMNVIKIPNWFVLLPNFISEV